MFCLKIFCKKLTQKSGKFFGELKFKELLNNSKSLEGKSKVNKDQTVDLKNKF